MTISLGFYDSYTTSEPIPPEYMSGAYLDPPSNLTTFTYTDVNLGEDFPGRQIVVAAIMATSGVTGLINSITVGGTPLVRDSSSYSDRTTVALFRGTPSGETADVVVVSQATTYNGAIALYSMSEDYFPVESWQGANAGIPDAYNYEELLVVASAYANTQAFNAPIVTDYVSNTGFAAAGHSETPGPQSIFFASTHGAYTKHAACSYVTEWFDPPSGETVFDSFNRRDNMTRVGVSTSGHLWRQAYPGIMGVMDGGAYRVSGYPNRNYVHFGEQDMEVIVRSRVTGSYWPVVGARLNSDGTGGYWIAKNNNATIKLVGYGSTYPVANDDRVGLRVVEHVGATHVELLVNEVTQITWVDTRVDRPMGVYAGLEMGNAADIRADDFIVQRPGRVLYHEDFNLSVTDESLSLFIRSDEWIPVASESSYGDNWMTDKDTGYDAHLEQRVNGDSLAIRPIFYNAVLPTQNHFVEGRVWGANGLGVRPGLVLSGSGTTRSNFSGYVVATQYGNIDRYDNGVATRILQLDTTSDVSYSTLHRLEHEGTELRYYRNGILMGSVTDSSPLSGVYSGFFAGRDVSFDDFKTGTI